MLSKLLSVLFDGSWAPEALAAYISYEPHLEAHWDLLLLPGQPLFIIKREGWPEEGRSLPVIMEISPGEIWEFHLFQDEWGLLHSILARSLTEPGLPLQWAAGSLGWVSWQDTPLREYRGIERLQSCLHLWGESGAVPGIALEVEPKLRPPLEEVCQASSTGGAWKLFLWGAEAPLRGFVLKRQGPASRLRPERWIYEAWGEALCQVHLFEDEHGALHSISVHGKIFESPDPVPRVFQLGTRDPGPFKGLQVYLESFKEGRAVLESSVEARLEALPPPTFPPRLPPPPQTLQGMRLLQLGGEKGRQLVFEGTSSSRGSLRRQHPEDRAALWELCLFEDQGRLWGLSLSLPGEKVSLRGPPWKVCIHGQVWAVYLDPGEFGELRSLSLRRLS